MRHYEQIVEDISTILTADADPTEEALRDADARYAEAVNEVNERLVMCDKLLHKGHRTEAIQQGELEPKLLDAVALLDFPELESWGEYVRQFGLAGPPDLHSDIAEDLNAAYDLDAELEDVLKDHRLLALARAPLGTRLRVLRQIARRDWSNPIWLEDVRSWEQVRLGQLGKELEAAVSRNDLTGIAQLDQEVRSGDWLAPPPDAICKRIRVAHGQVRVKRARRELEGLEKELTEAYANFDVPRARKLRGRWEELAKIGIRREDDPLLEMAAPALHWLAEQERQAQQQSAYESAIARLEAALSAGAPRPDLERLAHTVSHFESGLPVRLEERVQERFAELELASRRRTSLALTAVVMSVLLIAGLTAWGIHSHGRGTQLVAHEQNMTELLRARRLPEARSYLENLQQDDPALYATPQLQNLQRDLETAERTEEARQARFAQLLEDARQQMESWDGYPDALRNLRDADETLEQAPEHVKDAWRQDLELARNEVEAVRRGMQDEINTEWQSRFQTYRQQYDSRNRTDLDELQRLLIEGQLLGKAPRVDSGHRNQVEPLLDRLEQDIDTLRRTMSERDLLRRIADAVGDRERYVRSLKNYLDGFSHRPRAADFRQVLENESSYWEGIERWQPIINRFAELQIMRTPPDDAARLIADAEPLLVEHPGFPFAADVQQMLEYLAPIQARVQSDGSRSDAGLVRLLGQPMVKDFLVVLHRPDDGPLTRYYFQGAIPESSGNILTVTHRTETSGDRTAQAQIPIDEIRNPKSDNAFDWSSPQQKFFDLFLEEMHNLSDSEWEATFFRIVQGLLSNDEIDPILKVELLRLVLSVACEGSYALQQTFGGWLESIEAAEQDGRLNLAVNWVNPQEAGAPRARAAAERVLANLGSVHAPGIQAQQYLREMQSSRNWPRYRWVGSLLRDEDRNWRCLPDSRASGTISATDLPEGTLLVVHSGSGGEPRFTTIGRLQDGEVQFARDSIGAQVEGRPVYLVTDLSGSGS